MRQDKVGMRMRAESRAPSISKAHGEGAELVEILWWSIIVHYICTQ